MTWLPLLATAGLLLMPKSGSRTKNRPGSVSGQSGPSPASDSSGQYNRYIRTSRNCGRCMMER